MNGRFAGEDVWLVYESGDPELRGSGGLYRVSGGKERRENKWVCCVGVVLGVYCSNVGCIIHAQYV